MLWTIERLANLLNPTQYPASNTGRLCMYFEAWVYRMFELVGCLLITKYFAISGTRIESIAVAKYASGDLGAIRESGL